MASKLRNPFLFNAGHPDEHDTASASALSKKPNEPVTMAHDTRSLKRRATHQTISAYGRDVPQMELAFKGSGGPSYDALSTAKSAIPADQLFKVGTSHRINRQQQQQQQQLRAKQVKENTKNESNTVVDMPEAAGSSLRQTLMNRVQDQKQPTVAASLQQTKLVSARVAPAGSSSLLSRSGVSSRPLKRNAETNETHGPFKAAAFAAAGGHVVTHGGTNRLRSPTKQAQLGRSRSLQLQNNSKKSSAPIDPLPPTTTRAARAGAPSAAAEARYDEEALHHRNRASIMTPEPILDTPLSVQTVQSYHQPARPLPSLQSQQQHHHQQQQHQQQLRQYDGQALAQINGHVYRAEAEERPAAKSTNDNFEIFRTNAWPNAKEQKRYQDMFHNKTFFVDVEEKESHQELTTLIESLHGHVTLAWDETKVDILVSQHVKRSSRKSMNTPLEPGGAPNANDTPIDLSAQIPTRSKYYISRAKASNMRVGPIARLRQCANLAKGLRPLPATGDTAAMNPHLLPAAAAASSSAAVNGGMQKNARAVTTEHFEGDAIWLFMGTHLRSVWKDYEANNERTPQIFRSGLLQGCGPFHDYDHKKRHPMAGQHRQPVNKVGEEGKDVGKEAGVTGDDGQPLAHQETPMAVHELHLPKQDDEMEATPQPEHVPAAEADGKEEAKASKEKEDEASSKEEDCDMESETEAMLSDDTALPEEWRYYRQNKTDPTILLNENVTHALGYTTPTFLRKEGYCEPCKLQFKSYTEHVASAEHRSFAEKNENYADIDALAREVQSMQAEVVVAS